MSNLAQKYTWPGFGQIWHVFKQTVKQKSPNFGQCQIWLKSTLGQDLAKCGFFLNKLLNTNHPILESETLTQSPTPNPFCRGERLEHGHGSLFLPQNGIGVGICVGVSQENLVMIMKRSFCQWNINTKSNSNTILGKKQRSMTMFKPLPPQNGFGVGLCVNVPLSRMICALNK